ncbi:c-type cytochrome [Aliamphritea spongicola]
MTGVAGAPKVGDPEAWKTRIEKGVEGMLATAKSGLNVMPPMGNCQNCTDSELTAAIQHMLDNSK